ncbi:scp-like extracellular [Achlya hypogyna]|uniref:Scp-like extracellular n=1 Tax=Achlya hypogyna TaxID=1202772 RepID=A0A1V9ZI13_ACHHY|nr:scp-like extracellular [Achlya hypogyna]
MGGAVSSDVISATDDATLIKLMKEAIKKDPARIDRLIAAAKDAARTESGTVAPVKKASATEPKEPEASNDTVAASIASELNALRTNPKSFLVHCEEMLKNFDGKILAIPSEGIRLQTDEGATAVQECIAFLKTQAAMPPLMLDDNLSKAAQDHATDLGENGTVSHTGQGTLLTPRDRREPREDGSSMVQRLDRYGEWKGSVGELLAFGLTKPRNIVLQLLVDDGVPSRDDRLSLLDAKFTTLGIGTCAHKFQKSVCVLDFSGGFGPLVEKLLQPKTVTVKGELTPDVELILQSIPFEELKIEVRDILAHSPSQTVALNYKPGSIEVTVTNPDGSSQIKSGTWGVAAPNSS